MLMGSLASLHTPIMSTIVSLAAPARSLNKSTNKLSIKLTFYMVAIIASCETTNKKDFVKDFQFPLTPGKQVIVSLNIYFCKIKPRHFEEKSRIAVNKCKLDLILSRMTWDQGSVIKVVEHLEINLN